MNPDKHVVQAEKAAERTYRTLLRRSKRDPNLAVWAAVWLLAFAVAKAGVKTVSDDRLEAVRWTLDKAITEINVRQKSILDQCKFNPMES